MSKFNSYAKKVDEIAKAAFEEYRKAEKALNDAQKKADNMPAYKVGMPREYNTLQYEAKRAQAQADVLQAKENLRKAKTEYAKHLDEIKALRSDLEADLNNHYAADPAALDSNTLELLKSGLLKTNEYDKLMNDAEAAGNYTMARMIAKYAGDAAAEFGRRYGENSAQARTLRAISYKANEYNGKDTLDAFDGLTEVYSRSVNNPAMIDHWGELTGDIVENM